MKFLTIGPGIVWALFFGLLVEPLSVRAEVVLQGDPFLRSLDGASRISDVKTVVFNGNSVPVFWHDDKPTILFGIDLKQKPGSYGLVYELQNGDLYAKLVRVEPREKPQEELGIPEKLGGNTKQAQTALVNSLIKENSILAGLYTGNKSFWTLPFQYPVPKPVITDPYGYIRQTGSYSISHKGVDFRAGEGAPVRTINRGVVRLVKDFTIYGKTVVIDHGLGVMSFYMHLSQAKVNVGELVMPGQEIGSAGQTGYAESPHLHLSVRINNVSVDPIAFLELLKN